MHFFTFCRLSDKSSSKDDCALHTLARIKVSLPNDNNNSNSNGNNSNEIVLSFTIFFHLCGAYQYEHQIIVKIEVLRCGMEETLVLRAY